MQLINLNKFIFKNTLKVSASELSKTESQSRRLINDPSHVKPNAGFTLLEIMVVIAIMGILATLVIPKLMGRPDDARVVAAKHDVGVLVQALKLYRLDVGQYPTSDQGLKALVERPSSGNGVANWKTGGYLDAVPNDPWGYPYQYTIPGKNGEIDIFSQGADGKAGGEGIDADIGNW